MLTWRSSTSGKLHAAYLGAVRVGYAEEGTRDGWTWSLSLLQPSGGAYRGRASTVEEAKALANVSAMDWIRHAGLTREK